LIFAGSIKRTLDRAIPVAALAPLLTQVARWQGKGLRRVFRDGDVWIHATEIGYFAYPHPYLRLDLRRLDEIARRNFFWGYTPESGDIIIDVGAGVGEETLTFARSVGERGRVICIEAHPKTYRCLKALVHHNRLANVIPIQQAVTEPLRQKATIEDSPDYLRNRLGSSEGIPVPATTLDEIYVKLRLGTVNFLKMNIEGAERLAIRGMAETLKHTQTVCICCHDFLAGQRCNESCRTTAIVQDFLWQSGFTVVQRSEPGAPSYIKHQVWAYHPRVAAVAAS
jgi:FkbM family methyltransferase